MKKVIFILCVLMFSFSCNTNSKNNFQEKNTNSNAINKVNESEKKIDINKGLLELKDIIIGKWRRNDDPLYSLDFRKNDTKKIECTFSNGGPFEEYLTFTITNDKKIDLYFNYIVGTISFTEANNPSNKDSCKTKVIAISLIDKNQLLMYPSGGKSLAFRRRL